MQGGITMKRMFFIVAAFVVIVFPAVASAASPKAGPYVSAFIGVSVPQNADVTGSDTNPGVANPSINDRIEFDPSINIGGSGGYDFGYVRLEGELSYKRG